MNETQNMTHLGSLSKTKAKHDDPLLRIAAVTLIVLVVTLVATLFTIEESHATVVIRGDNGGYVDGYRSQYSAIRASGERVVVDGDCLSACTLLLAMVSPRQVCVTSRAIFGFHAVRYRGLSGDYYSDSGTARLLSSYPARIQNWIARNGGLTDDLILLTGPELTRMFPGQYSACAGI